MQLIRGSTPIERKIFVSAFSGPVKPLAGVPYTDLSGSMPSASGKIVMALIKFRRFI